MPLNLNQCDQACFDCIKKYKCKHSLAPGQKFDIKCNGIPSAESQLSLFGSFPVEEQETARTMLDPVTWAAKTLDWHCLDEDGEVWKRKNPDEYWHWVNEHPGESIIGRSRYHRPYQALMLRCQARRKVFRIGRQCLVGSTSIVLENGINKLIKDIKVQDKVLTLNLETNTIETSRVLDAWSTGVRKVYRILTKFGHTIDCTSDHRFLTIPNFVDRFHNITVDTLDHLWSSIEDGLSVGHKIAVPVSINSFGKRQLGALAPFLGYFIADGSSSYKQSAKFTNTKMLFLLEFEDLAKSLGTEVKWYTKGNGFDLIITNGRRKSNPLREQLKDLGLCNIKGPQKFVPQCILEANKEDIRLFLNRFWSADGYISTFQRPGRSSQRTEIGTLQESKLLLQQIQTLLWKFGVHGYIKKEGNCYRLVISNKISIRNFLNNIGPIFGKESACDKAGQNLVSITDKYVSTSNDVLWDYISSIELLGEQETYDIEVEKTHNFIANGIITHNCGKTESIVVSMLYHMFTKPGIPDTEGFEIVVITPYQSQIDLIFTRLLQLIRSSPLTNNSLRRSVKAPIYQIQLHNESTVKGFTAGTKSGGNADAVRGQHAHMLVFDEADYLSSGDMDSALSIITNYPTASMWMSSTPSGKREKFYQTCSSTLFKEFYFPSQANPMWDQQLEQLFREQLTEIGYKHEVLADFGEQEEGVFQNVYVQEAKGDYEYGSIAKHHSWTYSIGVDWNDVKNGTTIAVVGFNPHSTNKKFVVVDRHTISRDGWTQLSAMEKIRELNRTWRPQYIYLDKGYGGTQWEFLRKCGFDALSDPARGPTHPDAFLRNVVAYDFGSKIEVRDPFTHQPISKDAKPFLVESAVRRFEATDLVFPASDKMLERQLLGFIIDHVTPTGRPIYRANDEQAGDHILDALMLALVAFTLEASPLGKPKFKSNIAFSGYFGENPEPEIYPGDTVIKPAHKTEKYKEARERQKPDFSRSQVGEQGELFPSQELPAAHTNREGTVGLWSWNGFSRDEPRPRVRTIEEAGQDARRRLGLKPRMGGKPRRKNI